MNKVNILTIDVEDYFQVENFKSKIKFSDWGKYESRVEKNTEKILKMLDEYEVKATFFVLGWIGEKYPALVKSIHQDGHEIASHGYAHTLVHLQAEEEFREDVRKSKAILEKIIGGPVLGYRAPAYSITKDSLWALQVLLEEGFEYDSSLFPIFHDRGGLPDARRDPHKIPFGGKSMWEVPISTRRILGQNFPFSGGGYFRLLPYALIKGAVKAVNKEGMPVVIYIHPWEIDPEQPRVKASRLASFRHYNNLKNNEEKLRKLLSDFSFTSISEYLKKRKDNG